MTRWMIGVILLEAAFGSHVPGVGGTALASIRVSMGMLRMTMTFVNGVGIGSLRDWGPILLQHGTELEHKLSPKRRTCLRQCMTSSPVSWNLFGIHDDSPYGIFPPYLLLFYTWMGTSLKLHGHSRTQCNGASSSAEPMSEVLINR